MTSDPENGAQCPSLHQESISESEEKSHDQNTDKCFQNLCYSHFTKHGLTSIAVIYHTIK